MLVAEGVGSKQNALRRSDEKCDARLELMRHEDIQTTMKFYFGRNAERTAKTLWEVHKQEVGSNTSGNSGPKQSEGEEETVDVVDSHASHFSKLPGLDSNQE